jgi:hypothetical protein
MLKQILEMLHNIDNCQGYENIQIAKGKYEYTTNLFKLLKRTVIWQ